MSLNFRFRKSIDLDEEKQCESDLFFLLNCYKSREESIHSIREFYGKYSENRNKFLDFDSLQKKINYFCDEFSFHDKIISKTEDEITQKYLVLKANTIIKKQLLNKFVNNILKINSSFLNKLNHGIYENDYLKTNEFILTNSFFRDNIFCILKEENLNIFKLLNYIVKISRAKLETDIKKMKIVFLSILTRKFFDCKNLKFNENAESKKILSPPSNRKKKKKRIINKQKNMNVCKSLIDQNFTLDALQFLDSVRRKYILPNSLNLPLNPKKNCKLIPNQNNNCSSSINFKSNKKNPKFNIMPEVYNILQISECKPSLYLNDDPSELITEKFERMFNELIKANNYTKQTLKKYHDDFMKHIQKNQWNDRKNMELKSEEQIITKPTSDIKIDAKPFKKEKMCGNKRSISLTNG